MPQNNKSISVSNPALKQAIETFHKEKNAQNLNAVAGALAGATLLMPAIVQLDPKKKVDPKKISDVLKNTPPRYQLLTLPDGKKYLPAFTDQEGFESLKKQRFQPGTLLLVQAVPFDRAADMLANGQELSGLIINPHALSIKLEKAMIADIKRQKDAGMQKRHQIKPGDKVTLVEPTVLPDALLDPVCEALHKYPAVGAAYLQVMIINETDKSYLMVLDGPQDTAIFNDVLAAAKPYLTENRKMNLSVTHSASPLGQQGMNGSEPFYRKGIGRIYEEDDE